MSELLLLRLEGPLQSWGTRARWDFRDTGDEPTKSGIVGLLGCALGCSRYDPYLEILSKNLTLGIRVENPGTKVTDFQTISGHLPMASGKLKPQISTIISEREYLQDAAFLVVLSAPTNILIQCFLVLSQPKWPIYLGRKSCIPSRPILQALTHDYETVEDALRKEPWEFGAKQLLKGKLPPRLRCILESADGNVIRTDQVRINPARMYGTRNVNIFYVDFPGEKEETADVPFKTDIKPG